MKLELLTKQLIRTKESLKARNKEYFNLKHKQDKTFSLMISEKKQLKLVQCMYWNNRDIRNDTDFIKLYESINTTYKDLKKEYNHRIKLIKLSKRLINERQQQIGKITHKIINYNNL